MFQNIRFSQLLFRQALPFMQVPPQRCTGDHICKGRLRNFVQNATPHLQTHLVCWETGRPSWRAVGPSRAGGSPRLTNWPIPTHWKSSRASRPVCTDMGLSVLLTYEKEAHKRWKQETKEDYRETLWACTGRARKSSLHAVPRGSARGSEHRTKLHAALSSRQSRWMRWSPSSAMLWFFWKRNLSTTPVLSQLEKWYTFWLSSTKTTTPLPEFYKHIIPKRLGTTDLQDCWHFKHRNSENCWTEDLMKIQSSRVSKCCYIKVITELPKQHHISDKDGHVSGYNSPACRHLRVSTSQPGGLGWVTCLLS